MQASLLIIDDDKSITTMLYENFIEDYDVQIANNGKEGIEKFTKTTPHAVILDLRMSGMNGFEVLKKLKAISPSTPVIMLTASGDIETATQALKIGTDQFLTKPVDITALNSIVAKVAILCEDTCQHLPLETRKRIFTARHDEHMEVLTLKEAEKRQIFFTLHFTHYNKSATAKLLGIDTSTLWRKLKRYETCTD